MKELKKSLHPGLLDNTFKKCLLLSVVIDVFPKPELSRLRAAVAMVPHIERRMPRLELPRLRFPARIFKEQSVALQPSIIENKHPLVSTIREVYPKKNLSYRLSLTDFALFLTTSVCLFREVITPLVVK